MTRKRDILSHLTRDELLAAIDTLGLEVADRRAKDPAIEVLAASKRASLSTILGDFKRARLKELCRLLDLDDSGREKAEIIDRLAGVKVPAQGSAQAQLAFDGGSTEPAKPRRGRPPKRAGAASGAAAKSQTSKAPSADEIARQVAEAQQAGKLTREQLEGYLWAAADILRGSIDSSDYKSFIFGLLFLKRLSDRFDEECVELAKEGIDTEDPDEHQFFVPPEARWSHIQKATTNIGEVLNIASARLEDANSKSLEGVLGGVDYNDQNKLGDTKQRDTTLHKLVQHFAQVDLKNSSLSEPDMLGRAYEYLIEKFADDAGKKGGEFYTPSQVVRLLVELLEPAEGMRICDPTCGSGGMLVQSAHYIVDHGGQAKNFSLFGQEKNLGTWAICKMNMLLHGFPDARIEKGDTLRDPKLLESGELMRFDRVIANPPFSLDSWGIEEAGHDPHGRFRFGLPPKGKGDLAFVQHMVATLNAQGRAAVVMPHGVLFRGGAEGTIRQGMLEEDLVEAVIGLPSNLFYGTGIPAAVLLLNRDKPKARKGKVLFVEASREYREGSAQNFLRPEDVAKVTATVKAYADVERYARVVPLEEIAKNDFNLNISRYVETAEAQEKIDVGDAVRQLRDAERARDEAKAVMDRFLEELGYGGA
ncbi:MAG: SAM-dependent DNA methyltransferase [Sandaracinaceae bacterium]|nr:SAM-dependent DNA methyltransferase [Sandaracinaceae bacterium]